MEPTLSIDQIHSAAAYCSFTIWILWVDVLSIYFRPNRFPIIMLSHLGWFNKSVLMGIDPLES